MRHTAFLMVLAVCLGFGCGPAKPTPSNDVNLVAAEDLCRIYRHNPKDRTFTGTIVQCVLEPKSYRVKPGLIEAICFAEDRPGCLQFECSFVPPNNLSRLVVTGRCIGIIRDGVQREATTDFYVCVESCTLTMLEP